MKITKKLLLMIAIVLLVMATSMNVAFGEPTATASPPPSPTATETPGTSESTETTESTETGTVSSEPTFTLLALQSMGEDVMRLQIRLRQLGYFNYRATGLYFGMTEKAVKQYQEQNGLSADGQCGEITYNDLFTIDAIRRPLASTVVPQVGEQSMKLATPVFGELSSWDEVNAIFTQGMTVTVTDFRTGDSFQLTRTGGTNHADVESTDADNYNKFKDCFGGADNWGEKRSVLVEIGGVQYAASLFSHPSGKDTIAENGMAGHSELYFNGSTSDILGFTDRYHQEKVLIAAGEIDYK
jgi:Putative peptidoglycan-binding domain-containing protein